MPGLQTRNSAVGPPSQYDIVRNEPLTAGSQIVPLWAPIQTDALTHGVPCGAGSGSGYFNIIQAYGKGANCCEQKYAKTGCMTPGPRSPWGY